MFNIGGQATPTELSQFDSIQSILLCGFLNINGLIELRDCGMFEITPYLITLKTFVHILQVVIILVAGGLSTLPFPNMAESLQAAKI